MAEVVVKGRGSSAPPSPRREAEESPFSVADYVQLACMGSRSAKLILVRGGRVVGYIQTWQGHLWHAKDPRGSGVEAFERLLFRSDLRCHVSTLRAEERAPRSILDGWQHVLINAARRKDESDRAESGGSAKASGVRRISSPPAPAARAAQKRVEVPPPPRVVRRAFHEAYEDGVEALLARRFPEAFEAFREAEEAQPGDPRVRANLDRLTAMGFGEGDDR
jgi:hypothetical protein